MALANVDARFARTFHQDPIEFRSRHLIGLRLHDFGHSREVDAPPAQAVVCEKPRAPFDRKIRCRHFFGEAEGGEGFVGGGEKRLADVKARESLAFEENDRMSALRERDGCRAAGRAAAGDGEIEVVGQARSMSCDPRCADETDAKTQDSRREESAPT